MKRLLVLQYLMEYAKVVACHPYCFFIYMDDLSLILSESGTSCHMYHTMICLLIMYFMPRNVETNEIAILHIKLVN